MIEVIKIKNYALIEDAEIELNPHLNIITGETGAGKSLFINALNLLMGEKSSNQIIGKNGKEASVEAVININNKISNILEKNEIEYENDQIIIKRVIGEKNRCYINGGIVSQTQLKNIMESFLDICSQNENQSLLKPSHQREIIDLFLDKKDLLSKVKELFYKKNELNKSLELKIKENQELNGQKEFIEFQLSEIDNLSLTKEDENLDYLIEDFNKKIKIKDLQSIVYENIYGSIGIISKMKETLIVLKDLDLLIDSKNYEAIKDGSELFLSLIRNIPKNIIGIDEELFDFYLKRKEELSKFIRKYGSIKEIFSKKRDLENKLMSINSFEEDILTIRKSKENAEEEYLKISEKLSKERKNAAEKLEKLIESNLKNLNMPYASFKIEILNGEHSEYGADNIKLLISPNRAEPLKELKEIASGGELSRVILSIRSVSSESKLCYLFDEIDAGIGGNTAFTIGKKLKKISEKRQVICITHLPQVAVFADSNYRIEKIQEKNKTVSRIEKISNTNLVDEISRMLGSSLSGDKAKDNAIEMIKNAKI